MNQEERTPLSCRNCSSQLIPNARFCHQCGAPVSADFSEDTLNKLFDNDSIFATGGPLNKELPKLYHIYSVVNNFRYRDIFYDNLKINWFVVERETPQVPFERVITNYSLLSTDARVNPENHIKEKFTLEEAELLKQFLALTQRLDAVIEEKLLPIGKDEKGYHDLPPAQGTDFIALYKKPQYNLPFKVEGIFNIKMADERFVPDERITVISKIPTEFLNR